MRSAEHVREIFGGELETTNNRMELTAVIEALIALKRPCKVTLFLDSEYVRKGITEWIHGTDYLKTNSPVAPRLEGRTIATDQSPNLLTQLQGTTYDFR